MLLLALVVAAPAVAAPTAEDPDPPGEQAQIAPPPPAVTAGAWEQVLRAGESLPVGSALRSPHGRVHLDTTGGGLAVRRDGRVIWRNGLLDRNAARLDMQGDGNLVLRTARGTALWTSRTAGRGAADLWIQDDGNLVLRDRNRAVLWQTGIGRDTSRMSQGMVLRPGQSMYAQDGLTQLAMQADGNLVLYRYDQAMWHVRTRARGAHLQISGIRAYLRAPDGRVVWATPARSGGSLTLQDDGNLVFYAGGRALWSSGTWQPNCRAVTGPISPWQTRAGANGAILADCYVGRWNAMVRAARAQGVTLSSRSSYRSTERQIQLRIRNCGGNTRYNIWEKPSPQCDPPTAVPGRSNHEWGLAVDVRLTGAGGRRSPQYRWLAANGPKYGFFNYTPEPWHWSIDSQ